MGNEISITRKEIKEKIEKYPYLNIGDKIGDTEYIDFLQWDEVKYPVMYGVDSYNRLFFVIKAEINGQQVMQTFFQRYSNKTSLWNSGGNNTANFIRTEGGMTDNQFKFLFKLISEKEAELENIVKPSYDFFVNKKIKLYEYEIYDLLNNFNSLTF
jgi:hypothetical protein